MNPKNFADSLIKYGLAEINEFQGCSESEIEQLENHIGSKLPKLYREFLLLMGHNAGIYNRGSDFLYHDLFDNTEYTRKTMFKQGLELPNDAFVILSHQGYIFAWFLLSDGDNPPVYSYSEAGDKPIKFADSFSDYLEKSLKEAITFSSPEFTLEDYVRFARKGMKNNKK